MSQDTKIIDGVKAVIAEPKKEVKAEPYILEKAKRLRREDGGRPTRDSTVDEGPLKVDFKYYKLDEANTITRFVHVEEPGRLEKFIRLGYEFVHDPLTGEPVVKEVRVGSEKRKSYLLKTDKALYDQGQKEKSTRVKEGLARMDTAADGMYVSESNLNK